MRLGPQRLHHPHLVGRALAAVVEILVEAGELDLVPADADPEPEPPAAQHIERRRLLGDQRRLALRQDQDARGEADALGAAGEKAEQHKRVVIGGRRGADAPPAMIGVRVAAEHVVGRQQIGKAEPLGRLRVIADDRGAGADIADRQRCAKLHVRFPLPDGGNASPDDRISHAPCQRLRLWTPPSAGRLEPIPLVSRGQSHRAKPCALTPRAIAFSLLPT